MILIDVVYVKAQVEAQTLAERPLLRKRGLPPDEPRRLQGVAAERPEREARRIREAIDVEVTRLRGEREPVRSDVDVRQFDLVVRFKLNRPVRAGQIDVRRARKSHRERRSCLERLAVDGLPTTENRIAPAAGVHPAAALSHREFIGYGGNPAMADIEAGAGFFQSAVVPGDAARPAIVVGFVHGLRPRPERVDGHALRVALLHA